MNFNNEDIVGNTESLDFTKTILSFDGKGEQLEYIQSSTNKHIFKGSVEDKKNGFFDYALKVIAHPKNEIHGNSYNLKLSENAELEMMKVLGNFVINHETPHIILPICTFRSNINIFASGIKKYIKLLKFYFFRLPIEPLSTGLKSFVE